MPTNYYDDDEDLQRQRPQATGGAVTFSQLQQQGIPRPPPMTSYGGAGGIEYYGDPRRRPVEDAPKASPYATGSPTVGAPPQIHPTFGGVGGLGLPPQFPPGVNVGQIPSGVLDGGGPPTAGGQEPLNQSTLEAYLYQMLTDPTSTQPYQHMMRRLQSGIDVDASRRGVFHSTIPVSAGAEAGSNLAAQMQQEAFNNLRGFNQDYAQLLSMLLGLT